MGLITLIQDILNFIFNIIINIMLLIFEIIMFPFRLLGWIFSGRGRRGGGLSGPGAGPTVGRGGYFNNYFNRPWGWGWNHRNYF